MTTANPLTTNEAEIRQLIADQQRAICTKDVDQIMSRYAAESVIFDVKPPFQTKGREAVRQLWEDGFPCFPDFLEMETRDLIITANDEIATAHWLFRFKSEQDHPATQLWMRATTVCQKKEGNWQILHEHISVPFDPTNAQAVFTLTP
jgi:ketosteroid isomerase-like protein